MVDSEVFIIAVVIVSILLSMTLHEAMHAFTSYWLGDDTAEREGRLTLNPFKHIDPFLTVLLPLSLILLNISNISSRNVPVLGAARPVPFNPNRVKWDEFGAGLVGVAGPLTNLLLAVASAGILRLVGVGTSDTFTAIVYIFVQVNIGFFVFNMLPFPPLDGSRLVYALAPEPLQRVMQSIESLGLMGLVLFMLVFLPYLSPLLETVNNFFLNTLL